MAGRDNVQDIYPLTPFQEGVLFHDLMAQTDGPSTEASQRPYFQQMVFTMRGTLDPVVFDACWQRLVARHDILRTVFRSGGERGPVQIVLKELAFAPQWQDMTDLPPDEREAAVSKLIEDERHRPFDLKSGPLMRVVCVKTDDLETVVAWSFHHILFDGWCIGILQDELSTAYTAMVNGEAPPVTPAPRFAEFVKWSMRRRSEGAVEYWARYLEGWKPGREIPIVRETSGGGEREDCRRRVEISPDAMERLTALARSEKITLSVLVQGLWGMLIARLNQTRDVVFGMPVTSRPAEVADVERMLGPCISTVPVRVRYGAGETAIDVLRRLGEQAADWLANSHVSLTEIQERIRSRGPVFDHYLVFENYPLDAQFRGEKQAFSPGLTVEGVEVVFHNSYDFSVFCQPEGQGFVLDLQYNERVVDADHVEHLAVRLETLIRELVAAPETPVDDLRLMTADEWASVTETWSRGAPSAMPSGAISEMRRRVVLEHGERPCLRNGERILTHREVEGRANALALTLRDRHGCGMGSVVALFANGGIPFMQALLACLKLGAAFVPIDPASPRGRVEHILEDCGARLILVDGFDALGDMAGDRAVIDLSRFNGDADPSPDLFPPVPAEAPAYVIYTSGTTGQPKGVRVSHRAVANYVGWLQRDVGVRPDDVAPLLTSASFDLAYTIIFGTLLIGGCLSVMSEDERRDMAHVREVIRDHRVTVLKITCSYLSMLLADREDGILAGASDLRLIVLGGEAQNFETLRTLRAMRPDVELWNHYGPTEATIGCVSGPLNDLLDQPDPPQRIGRPIAGDRILLVDPQLNPVPPELAGEILVLGAGLADGYVGHVSQDSERFVTLPWLDGTRAYRTGDHGRWLPDGTIHFLGRRDDQVKVRGYRFTLGGVEDALRALPEVREAAARVVQGNQTAELIAYLVPEAGQEISVRGLRSALAQTVPEVMIPSRFIVLSKMPLTANGKIDRTALELHGRDDRLFLGRESADPVEKGTETEETLREIWKEVLYLDHVGFDDDFFDLGGHSIKAILMAARLRKAMGRNLPVRRVFDFPTVRLLAAHLEETGPGTAQPIEPGTAAGPRLDLLLPLHSGKAGAGTLICLPPVFGTSTPYKELIDRLDIAFDVVGLQCPGFDKDEPFAASLEDLAAQFVDAAEAARPKGCLHLLGHSMGAHVAMEMAAYLERRGRSVRLILVDSEVRLQPGQGGTMETRVTSLEELSRLPHWTRILPQLMEGLEETDRARLERLLLHNFSCLGDYAFRGHLKADIVCFEAQDNPRPAGMAGFADLTDGTCRVHRIGGNHYTIFQSPHVAEFVRLLQQEIDEAR